MQSATQFLFETVEGLAVLALFAGSPVVLSLMSVKSIRPRHVAINGCLAILFGVPAGMALNQVKQGDGMGALLFLLAGAGTGLLAIAFLFGAISTGLIVVLRRDGQLPQRRLQSPHGRRSPSDRPLIKQYELWKASSRRPNATYQEYLQEAHPRYFPSSAWSIAAAVAALLVVAYLITR